MNDQTRDPGKPEHPAAAERRSPAETVEQPALTRPGPRSRSRHWPWLLAAIALAAAALAAWYWFGHGSGDQAKADAVYQGVREPLTADDIADCVTFMATRAHHVNIDRLVIRPIAQAAQHKVVREK